jgi:hypothetical protein
MRWKGEFLSLAAMQVQHRIKKKNCPEAALKSFKMF